MSKKLSNYFNTTRSTGRELAEFRRRAESQQDLILDYFRRRPGMAYSPSQVRDALNLTGAPITSIRRAITNLTSAGELEKTERQVRGPYGRPEYQWRLTRREPGQRELFG